MNNLSINLTLAAKNHFRKILVEKSTTDTIGIRFGIRDAGCSGYVYTIDFTNQKYENDIIFKFDEIKIFIVHEHIKYLVGTKIDYVKNGINNTLSFHNPNVIGACGCGKSFKFK